MYLYPVHDEGVTGIDYDPLSQQVLSASLDGTIVLSDRRIYSTTGNNKAAILSRYRHSENITEMKAKNNLVMVSSFSYVSVSWLI